MRGQERSWVQPIRIGMQTQSHCYLWFERILLRIERFEHFQLAFCHKTYACASNAKFAWTEYTVFESTRASCKVWSRVSIAQLSDYTSRYISALDQKLLCHLCSQLFLHHTSDEIALYYFWTEIDLIRAELFYSQFQHLQFQLHLFRCYLPLNFLPELFKYLSFKVRWRNHSSKRYLQACESQLPKNEAHARVDCSDLVGLGSKTFHLNLPFLASLFAFYLHKRQKTSLYRHMRPYSLPAILSTWPFKGWRW